MESAEGIGRRLASRLSGRRELALEVLGRQVGSGLVTEEQLASLPSGTSGDGDSPEVPEVRERLAALLARVRRRVLETADAGTSGGLW